MFRNYLAAALRNLVRNRLYAGINIAGLAVGFAAAILIALFVRDEFSYDTWIPGHGRVYYVTQVFELAWAEGQRILLQSRSIRPDAEAGISANRIPCPVRQLSPAPHGRSQRR